MGKGLRVKTLVLAGLVMLAAAPVAAERQLLGVGRLLSNDFFGDGRDRWRGGSYTLSLLRGEPWTGRPPEGLGQLLEYRLRTAILGPSSASGGGDRPYVGSISLGVHAHQSRGPFDLQFGADVVAVGPQTGISDAQERFHELIDAPPPAGTDTQLEDAFYLTGSTEVSRTVRMSDRTSARYFVEGMAGTEDLLRTGADLYYGSLLHDDLLLRDRTTGQLFRGVSVSEGGAAMVLGADVARVWDSEWLPEDRGVTALDTRYRVRGGVHVQPAAEISLFYGLTYLSEEFEDQPEGQFIGSVKLNFNF